MTILVVTEPITLESVMRPRGAVPLSPASEHRLAPGLNGALRLTSWRTLKQVASPLGSSVSSSVKWARWYYPSHGAAAGKVKRGSTSGAQHRKQELLSLAPAVRPVAVRSGRGGLGGAGGRLPEQRGTGGPAAPELEGSAAGVCAGKPEGKTSGSGGGLLACPPRIGRPPAPELDERRP